jgi:hypothetical protein
MFRVIFGFWSHSHLTMTQPEAENWQIYAQDTHKLFAGWNEPGNRLG